MDIHALFAKTLAPVLIPDPAVSGAKLYPLCIALWIVAASSPNVHGSGIAGFTHRRFHRRSRSQNHPSAGFPPSLVTFTPLTAWAVTHLTTAPYPQVIHRWGKLVGFSAEIRAVTALRGSPST